MIKHLHTPRSKAALPLLLCLMLLLSACAQPAPAATPEPVAPAASPEAELPEVAVSIEAPVADSTLDALAAEPALPRMDEALTEGGVGSEAAVELVRELYGETFMDKPQHYTYEGVVEDMGIYYYAIEWTEDIPDKPGEEAYLGHVYVSLDGEATFDGDADSIFMGGG